MTFWKALQSGIESGAAFWTQLATCNRMAAILISKEDSSVSQILFRSETATGSVARVLSLHARGPRFESRRRCPFFFRLLLGDFLKVSEIDILEGSAERHLERSCVLDTIGYLRKEWPPYLFQRKIHQCRKSSSDQKQRLAQSVGCCPRMPEVRGSNPAAAVFFFRLLLGEFLKVSEIDILEGSAEQDLERSCVLEAIGYLKKEWRPFLFQRKIHKYRKSSSDQK